MRAPSNGNGRHHASHHLLGRLVVLVVLLGGAGPAGAAAGDPHKGKFTIAEATKGIPGPAGSPLTATIETNKGTISCELYEKQTPITVANFVGLATGKRAWLDPKTEKWVKKKPFYDGLTFHRVIPEFMIQGGDPLGTGTGNPGYKFNDEIVAELKFDRPALLAMANAGLDDDGKGTNGSQFFVTEVPTMSLNGKHTIFGTCEPLAVVKTIARVTRGARDKPVEPVVMTKVTITRGKPAPPAASSATSGGPAAGGGPAAPKPMEKAPAPAPKSSGADKAPAANKTAP
jgi:peptidyl-prolyl cis-trans isomerase A (cyclophilin A)